MNTSATLRSNGSDQLNPEPQVKEATESRAIDLFRLQNEALQEYSDELWFGAHYSGANELRTVAFSFTGNQGTVNIRGRNDGASHDIAVNNR